MWWIRTRRNGSSESPNTSRFRWGDFTSSTPSGKFAESLSVALHADCWSPRLRLQDGDGRPTRTKSLGRSFSSTKSDPKSFHQLHKQKWLPRKLLRPKTPDRKSQTKKEWECQRKSKGTSLLSRSFQQPVSLHFGFDNLPFVIEHFQRFSLALAFEARQVSGLVPPRFRQERWLTASPTLCWA